MAGRPRWGETLLSMKGNLILNGPLRCKFMSRYSLPKKSRTSSEVLGILEEISRDDMDPHSGLMWAHSYEHGIRELWDAAYSAFLKFLDKTMLNFTVYPSILRLEREVVGIVASLMNGGGDVAGSFTYGGTESIMLAVKAAREHFRKKRGSSTVPEMLLPTTGHPAFLKAAEYLQVKVVPVRVDVKRFKVDLEDVKEKMTPNTALIVGSAPNYPFGTIDDIEGLGELAEDKDLWLHVDACMGGFILPFFERLGEKIPRFDFRVPGVYSISVDLHKYGYALKGSSTILYRESKYKLYQIYVNASWPGYPLVNTAVLSTRSAGPLAAAWVILNCLGEEGYLKLAKKVLNARNKLVEGLEKLGFKILGVPESSLLTFTHEEVNVSLIAEFMKKRGWYLQVQPGSIHLDFPKSIHLTISPIHEGKVEGFLEDLEECLEEARQHPPPPVEDVLEGLSKELSLEYAMKVLGLERGRVPRDMSLINELIYLLPPETVERMFKELVNELFKP